MVFTMRQHYATTSRKPRLVAKSEKGPVTAIYSLRERIMSPGAFEL